MRFLEAALARALGKPELRILEATALSGGCIHEARRLRTSEGDFFAKWSAGGPDDVFLREAEGLEALRAARAGIVVPRVIAASGPAGEAPAHLVLEYLPCRRQHEADREALGRGLAALHRAGSTAFGFPGPSYCGETRQDNRRCATWPEFYRERRLRPLIEALAQRGRLPAAERDLHERVLVRLDELLPAESTPSLIHGDLWAGNVLWTTRGPGLVDPACAYADREMEFGISTLFGGLAEPALAAYLEAWPLAPGWRDRNPLYQLYHLLNHALLFGGHYAGEARRIAARYA